MTDTDPEWDVVDLLVSQHARIEELFLLVGASAAEVRRDSFAELVRLITVHEAAEQQFVHPLARTGGGDAMVDDRLREEQRTNDMLGQLVEAGLGHPTFDTSLLLLREAVLGHCQNEERHEHPHLRDALPDEDLRELATVVETFQANAPRVHID
ncbi:hemerythrin domain-containing protein [Rhizomonospora bruguierae]|uniref:hemerythrin domain-containing protein n=1 Tax=Rhizomonospora bruguierae TaxID=1581705 RepID=UPI001BCC90DE|nr:hemerythrin domain-containing protein [Micromonospora sp. NBRC 107566]